MVTGAIQLSTLPASSFELSAAHPTSTGRTAGMQESSTLNWSDRRFRSGRGPKKLGVRIADRWLGGWDGIQLIQVLWRLWLVPEQLGLA